MRPTGWGLFEFQAGREIIATSCILRRESDTGRHKERPRKLVFCRPHKRLRQFRKTQYESAKMLHYASFISVVCKPNTVNFRHFIGFRRMWNEFIEVRTSSSESVLVNLSCLTMHRIQPQRQHWPRPPWHSKFQNKIIYNLRSVKACLRQCICTPCNWGPTAPDFFFQDAGARIYRRKRTPLGLGILRSNYWFRSDQLSQKIVIGRP